MRYYMARLNVVCEGVLVNAIEVVFETVGDFHELPERIEQVSFFQALNARFELHTDEDPDIYVTSITEISENQYRLNRWREEKVLNLIFGDEEYDDDEEDEEYNED